jgi:hypothetical protein
MIYDSLFAVARRRLRPIFALSVSLAFAACGNLTAGGYGEADVFVSGDDQDPAPTASVHEASAPSSAPSLLLDGDDEAEGEVEVEMELFLITETGEPVRLGRDELRVRVDLQGVEPGHAVVRQRISAPLRFTGLRMVFTEIRAEVEGGLVIDGVPILGEVHVELEDVHLEVVRPIDIDLLEGETVELVLDLNAPSWLAAVDPITRTVDENLFAALVSVTVD